MDFLYLIKFILYKGGLKNNRRLFLTFYEERIKKKKKKVGKQSYKLLFIKRIIIKIFQWKIEIKDLLEILSLMLNKKYAVLLANWFFLFLFYFYLRNQFEAMI